MKGWLYLLLISLAACGGARGQFYFYNEKYYSGNWLVEPGMSFVLMNSFTDIGGTKGIGKTFIKDLNWKLFKPGLTAYAAITWHDAIALRAEWTTGSIACYDSILKPVASSTFGRYERNLSFRSSINEFMLALEVHPFFLQRYDEDNPPPFVSPYIIAGIGYFYFNPQACLQGRWYSLEPLHLEGQGFREYPERLPYRLHQINLPVGAGIRYELSALLVARLELIHRILFTDYLDDVSQRSYIDPGLFNNYMPASQAAIAGQLYDRRKSTGRGGQRGDPDHNDSYFTIQLKLGVTIRRRVGH